MRASSVSGTTCHCPAAGSPSPRIIPTSAILAERSIRGTSAGPQPRLAGEPARVAHNTLFWTADPQRPDSDLMRQNEPTVCGSNRRASHEA